MGADEEELQPLVGEDRRFPLGTLGDDLERRRGRGRDFRVPRGVDEPPPRGGQQPGLGLVGNSDAWPRLECCQQRVAERVLGGRDVAP